MRGKRPWPNSLLFVQCFWKLVGKVIMVSLHFISAFVCCFRNFVSVELATKNHLAAGAIKFQVRKTGNPFHILHLHSFQRNHPVMNDILDKLATEFSGSEWGANGPLQLTKAMRKYCEDQMWSSKDGDTISRCKDVTVFKEEHFYPINWRQWPWMFNVKFIKTFSAPYHDTLSKFGNCLN